MRTLTPNELHAEVTAYIRECDEHMEEVIIPQTGAMIPVRQPRVPSHAGLAEYLGVSKAAVMRWINTPEDILHDEAQRAHTMIEARVTTALYTKDAGRGAQFYLSAVFRLAATERHELVTEGALMAEIESRERLALAARERRALPAADVEDVERVLAHDDEQGEQHTEEDES